MKNWLEICKATGLHPSDFWFVSGAILLIILEVVCFTVLAYRKHMRDYFENRKLFNNSKYEH